MSHKNLYRFTFLPASHVGSQIATGTLEFGQALIMNLLALYDRRGEQLAPDWVNMDEYTASEKSLLMDIPAGNFFALEMDSDVMAFIFQHDTWVRWVPTLPLR